MRHLRRYSTVAEASINQTRLARPSATQPPAGFAPLGTPAHASSEPSLLGQDHAVIRAHDDTDEDYRAKQRLLAASLRCYADCPDNEHEIVAIVARAGADIAARRYLTVATAAESDALHDAAMARLRARLAADDPAS